MTSETNHLWGGRFNEPTDEFVKIFNPDLSSGCPRRLMLPEKILLSFIFRHLHPFTFEQIRKSLGPFGPNLYITPRIYTLCEIIHVL